MLLVGLSNFFSLLLRMLSLHVPSREARRLLGTLKPATGMLRVDSEFLFALSLSLSLPQSYIPRSIALCPSPSVVPRTDLIFDPFIFRVSPASLPTSHLSLILLLQPRLFTPTVTLRIQSLLQIEDPCSIYKQDFVDWKTGFWQM